MRLVKPHSSRIFPLGLKTREIHHNTTRMDPTRIHGPAIEKVVANPEQYLSNPAQVRMQQTLTQRGLDGFLQSMVENKMPIAALQRKK